MLFLAVFCGFLAEYQLEHTIEKGKEKQFMRSMLEDLKADTANIANLNQQRTIRLQMCDSICTAIVQKTYQADGASFYYYGRNVSRRAFFYSADGTMQQLKNSGGLRLISKHGIAEKIIAYDVLYREIISQQQYVELQINEYRDIAGKVFNAGVFRSMPTSNDRILLNKPAGNPPLADDSPGRLNEMANKLNYWSLGSARLNKLLEQLHRMASELIALIQQEYRFA